jgi:hypothetical protein
LASAPELQRNTRLSGSGQSSGGASGEAGVTPDIGAGWSAEANDVRAKKK